MKVRVSIQGQNYTVRSQEDDLDLREIARYVDAKMSDVANKANSLDNYTVAMLAALNIASDFKRFQLRVDHELARMDRELSGISVLMDASLPPANDSTDAG
jgi:cell division protein ZapA